MICLDEQCVGSRARRVSGSVERHQDGGCRRSGRERAKLGEGAEASFNAGPWRLGEPPKQRNREVGA
jgi:hypothetical protein